MLLHNSDKQIMKKTSFNEIRSNARVALRGNYTTLIFSGIISIVISLLLMSFAEQMVSILFFAFFQGSNLMAFKIITCFFNILVVLILSPLRFGQILQYMKTARNMQPGIGDIFKPYDVHPKTILLITFLIYIFTMLAMLPLLISFILIHTAITRWNIILLFFGEIATLIISAKVFLDFSMAPYYFMDHPKMTAIEILKNSKKLIHGNRIRYMLFLLSFIGYALLGLATFFIGYIWILPYISASKSYFYQTLINKGKRIKPKPDWRPYISNADGFRNSIY